MEFSPGEFLLLITVMFDRLFASRNRTRKLCADDGYDGLIWESVPEITSLLKQPLNDFGLTEHALS